MHNAALIAETREVTMGEAEPEPRDVEPANIEDHYQFFAMLPTSTPRALLFLSCVPGAAQCNTLSCLALLSPTTALSAQKLARKDGDARISSKCRRRPASRSTAPGDC